MNLLRLIVNKVRLLVSYEDNYIFRRLSWKCQVILFVQANSNVEGSTCGKVTDLGARYEK